MAIPSVSREKILAAFDEFDSNDRDSKQWVGWEKKKNHKFAIFYNGQLYPVKAIIRYATEHFTNFSGGNQANKYIQERGFTIVPLHDEESPFAKIDKGKLNEILKRFALFREAEEERYLREERNYKLSVIEVLGPILQKVANAPEEAKNELHAVMTKKGVEPRIISSIDNLLTFQGYAQRDDLRVFLENTDLETFREVFLELLENDQFFTFRDQMNGLYEALFEKGLFAPNKKNKPSIAHNMIGLFLFCYDPTEYTLYKPKEYETFLKELGIAIPYFADIKYNMFRDFALFLVDYAKENNFPVDDIIDAHNLIYMYSTYEEMKEGYVVDQALKRKFEEFLAQKENQLFVAIREYRSEQLRQLLPTSSEIDISTFNREVWNIGYLLLNGVKISPDKFGSLDETTLDTIEHLIHYNQLEYVGNSIWGTASRVYGSSLTDSDDEKLSYIQSALEILNDSELDPMSKVEAICKVRGFGHNIATGLVMAYHPNEMALYNKESQQALKSLGYEFNKLDVFMEGIEQIKETVDAENYIQLDAFLYYLNREEPIPVLPTTGYLEPEWGEIVANIQESGMKMKERIIQRYHLSLKTRGFVILSGISGTGKTWLTENYAHAVGANHLLVPVAPNWTTNEDLLGYYNPIDGLYKHTEVSLFIEEAEKEYVKSSGDRTKSTPYHLVLDEMNLARIEYYFSKFLSLMEQRARGESAFLELSPDHGIFLPPNLYVVGTVNVDETTHGFADKVYDRAQLIEISVNETDIRSHIGEVTYRELLMDVWYMLQEVAPFSYRVIDEIKSYIKQASSVGLTWQEALDDQILQKILPKIKGTDMVIGEVLEQLLDVITFEEYPLSHEKLTKMSKGYKAYGITSYF
jgi:MoxR-like ATPase